MKKLIVTLALLYPLAAFSEIREIKSLTELPIQEFNQGWVVFDVDNTILKPTTEIGSHQWADYMAEKFMEAGQSSKEAKASQHKVFAAVQEADQVTVVEPEIYGTLSIIKEKVPVFALTARSNETQPITLEQLQKLKIDLNDSAPKLKNPFLLNRGVAFASGKEKGEFMLEIMASAYKKPSIIYFVDDKRYNLESLEKALTKAGIPFVGFRYGAADEDLKNFNPHLADLQWLNFKLTGKVIPNEEVLKKTYTP